MRIGIDGHMLGDHSGGNESYYRNILREMEIAPGDEVFLFIKPQAVWEEYMNKFHVVTFKECRAFRRNFIELTKLCWKYKLDVLHTQYFIPFVRPCPVVVTIHDICFEHYSNIFTRKEQLRQKILIPYAARHTRHIFTDSEHARNDIAATYGLDPDRITVTYNAVNENFRTLEAPSKDGGSGKNEILPEDTGSGNLKGSNRVQSDESATRSKFGIGDGPYILTVGNLQPRKNLPRLIRAYNSWRKNGGRGKLVIVGKKAWMFNDIMKAAASDSADIILTDYVSEEDLVRLYNYATCFVYPSFYEGFGIPPLEAMACGTPVAVSSATSLPEVVGDAGLYFDPFDEKEIEAAIQKLMTDEDLRKELCRKGLQQKEKFSWKKSAETIYKQYKKTK